MNSLYFEQELVPAHTISLHDLVETFLLYHPDEDRRTIHNITQAFRILIGMFPANKPLPDTGNFKPGYLVWFKRVAIEKNYARSQVERFLKLIKRVFAWAGQPRFDEGGTWDTLPPLVSSILVAELKTIKVTDADKCRENQKRTDVPHEYIEAVKDKVPPIIRAMMTIQYLTAARPNEVCKMKVGDLKKTKEEFKEYHRLYDGESWLYLLKEHKTKRSIGEKGIAIGLEEQDILKPYIEGKSDNDFVFTKQSKRGFGKPFTVDEYGRYIKRVIEKYHLHKLTSYQVKHTSLSDVSETHDRDKARALAGHTSEKTTAIYDHSDKKKVFALAKERNYVYKTQKRGTDHTSPCILRIYNEN